MVPRPRPRPGVVLTALLLAASMVLATPLMHRTQTIISLPPPGEEVALYSLSYKARAFEAKISSVKLTVASAEGSDPVEGEWRFLASNSDGQLHKVEIFTRLLDESGAQLGPTVSKMCMIGGGYKDFVCTVPLKAASADWKNAKSLRIVTDWLS